MFAHRQIDREVVKAGRGVCFNMVDMRRNFEHTGEFFAKDGSAFRRRSPPNETYYLSPPRGNKPHENTLPAISRYADDLRPPYGGGGPPPLSETRVAPPAQVPPDMAYRTLPSFRSEIIRPSVVRAVPPGHGGPVSQNVQYRQERTLARATYRSGPGREPVFTCYWAECFLNFRTHRELVTHVEERHLDVRLWAAHMPEYDRESRAGPIREDRIGLQVGPQAYDRMGRPGGSNGLPPLSMADLLSDDLKRNDFSRAQMIGRKKRLRRAPYQIARTYSCSFKNCDKSYGTLSHLNTHIRIKKHGPIKTPTDFPLLKKGTKGSTENSVESGGQNRDGEDESQNETGHEDDSGSEMSFEEGSEDTDGENEMSAPPSQMPGSGDEALRDSPKQGAPNPGMLDTARDEQRPS